MKFYPGFDIQPTTQPMGFKYGSNVFGPEVENRTLDSIRKSLRNPECEGPDPVYSIAMDVGKTEHLQLLEKLHLLFGTVTYAAGRLGDEPVRSQGHIHKNSFFYFCFFRTSILACDILSRKPPSFRKSLSKVFICLASK